MGPNLVYMISSSNCGAIQTNKNLQRSI